MTRYDEDKFQPSTRPCKSVRALLQWVGAKNTDNVRKVKMKYNICVMFKAKSIGREEGWHMYIVSTNILTHPPYTVYEYVPLSS